VKYAVDRGYSVVAALVLCYLLSTCTHLAASSVRNDAQGDDVVNNFPEYKGKVSYVIVPDIIKVVFYPQSHLPCLTHSISSGRGI
jgi:hypothetical protein